MFDFFKKKKLKEDPMATRDEKEIEKAKEDIAEKGKDSQTEKDRIDESIGEQERRSGNENSQNAKDRVDESEGAKRADEKREDKKDDRDARLDRLESMIDRLVTTMVKRLEVKEEAAEDKLAASKEKYGMGMGSAGSSGRGQTFTEEDVKKLLK